MTAAGLLLIALIGWAFFYVNVLLVRWIFRIDKMLAALESIDASLNAAPWNRPAAPAPPRVAPRRATP